MSEIKKRTEQRILDAAVELFAAQGFHGATTRAIAQLADVNEATLFRYFSRKQDLFFAALDRELSIVQVPGPLRQAMERDEHPECVLPLLFRHLLEIVRFRPNFVRLLHVGALEQTGADHLCRRHLGPTFAVAASYLDRCISRGVILDADPVTVGLGLFATAVAYQDFYAFLIGANISSGDLEQSVATHSRLWLRALAPHATRAPLERADAATV
jgi:AcrR family transcriptional regulator